MDDELTRAIFHKASKSQGNGACVEAAQLSDGRIAIRDSKDNGQGPTLVFTPAEWDAFKDGLMHGEFDNLHS
jgi:hypothetical protein